MSGDRYATWTQDEKPPGFVRWTQHQPAQQQETAQQQQHDERRPPGRTLGVAPASGDRLVWSAPGGTPTAPPPGYVRYDRFEGVGGDPEDQADERSSSRGSKAAVGAGAYRAERAQRDAVNQERVRAAQANEDAIKKKKGGQAYEKQLLECLKVFNPGAYAAVKTAINNPAAGNADTAGTADTADTGPVVGQRPPGWTPTSLGTSVTDSPSLGGLTPPPDYASPPPWIDATPPPPMLDLDKPASTTRPAEGAAAEGEGTRSTRKAWSPGRARARPRTARRRRWAASRRRRRRPRSTRRTWARQKRSLTTC